MNKKMFIEWKGVTRNRYSIVVEDLDTINYLEKKCEESGRLEPGDIEWLKKYANMDDDSCFDGCEDEEILDIKMEIE